MSFTFGHRDGIVASNRCWVSRLADVMFLFFEKAVKMGKGLKCLADSEEDRF